MIVKGRIVAPGEPPPAAPRRAGPRTLWSFNGSIAAYSLIGGALYGVLGLLLYRVGPAAIRPGFALVPFMGFAFGPIAGFASGFIGQGVLEQLQGVAPETSWIHGVASGLTGLVAGLAPLYLPRLTRGTLLQRSGAGAVAAVFGAFAGGLVAFFQGGGATVGALFLGSYLPIALVNAAIGALLAPILVYAWDPLSEAIAS
jgi:energy-coupling factor transport system substrate-specific component